MGVGDGQGGLACRDSWGRKESDTTEQLNWTDTNFHQSKLQSRKVNSEEERCYTMRKESIFQEDIAILKIEYMKQKLMSFKE